VNEELIKPGMQIIFPEGNKIAYFQDHHYSYGVPHDVTFEVENKGMFTSQTDTVWLTAFGYGQLNKGEGSYGNGAIAVKLSDIEPILKKGITKSDLLKNETYWRELMNNQKHDMFRFAEWLGEHYYKLHKVWVHRYADQREEKNWFTTETLYEVWKAKVAKEQ
jgi:hypothetical protein